jgi:ABC-type dipeptide/oligopeptide/nickel transport system permease subunit
MTDTRSIEAQAEMVTMQLGLPWWQLLARDRLALCSAAWLVFLLVCMLFGPELLGKARHRYQLARAQRPPGSTEQGWLMILGGDALGHQHARAPGGRNTLTVAFTAVVVALIVGGVLGLIAGYVGRGVGNLIMRLSDVIRAFRHCSGSGRAVHAGAQGCEPHHRIDGDPHSIVPARHQGRGA